MKNIIFMQDIDKSKSFAKYSISSWKQWAEKNNSEVFVMEDLLCPLVDMGIDLDHYRTLTKIHAFVTDGEFQMISEMNFGIQEIPNQAKLYFQELKQNTMNSRNPMEDYHNYNEHLQIQ